MTFSWWEHDHVCDTHVNTSDMRASWQLLCRPGKQARSLHESLETEPYERSAPPGGVRRKNTRVHLRAPLRSNPGLFMYASTWIHPMWARVHVRPGSALSTAVDIFTAAVGAPFPSRCRRYHLAVTLHRYVPHSNKSHLWGRRTEGPRMFEEDKDEGWGYGMQRCRILKMSDIK